MSHGFGGKILDEISGLYQFGARYYAPKIGASSAPTCLLFKATYRQQVTDL
ncbi:hypothetical protein I6F15_19995 [Bradyrhizobium sp. BRP14]|nr:hypothetical protein [Bradyrhizobium sp. BRP14]